jgi:hypothetical protein
LGTSEVSIKKKGKISIISRRRRRRRRRKRSLRTLCSMPCSRFIRPFVIWEEEVNTFDY